MSDLQQPWYTRPWNVFVVICIINLMNYVDRGIIPGATNKFNKFIDADLNTDEPDVYLGLLQSSFIIGFMIGSLIFSNLVHHYGRFFLVAVGCSVWLVAVILCGFSYYTDSYVFLLFCRILSGVGEASIQTSIPPWIQQAAPETSRGSWLALFYTAIPVGTALGYAFSSVVAGEAGWQWAFFIEALIMVPFITFLYYISPYFPVDIPAAVSKGQQPSMWEELRAVCSSPIFICISFAYAAQAGTLQGLSTFGSAFLMGLGFFDTEAAASSVFGVVVSVTGMIATPLGGILLDRVLKDDETTTENIRQSFEIAERQLEAMVLTGEEQTSEVRRETAEAVRAISHAEADGSAAEQYQVQLSKIGKLTTILSAVATIAMCLVFFTRGVVAFMLLTALGSGLIFCTYSAINMGVMLSVPAQNRSFGIAINTLLLHALGDVPAPIIVGYLKDDLAPGCVADSGSDDDAVASSDACRDDADGLRTTILLTDMWMWWTVVFFALAWYLNKHRYFTFPCCSGAESEDMRSPLLRDDDAVKKAAQWDTQEVVVSQIHSREQENEAN